MAHFDTRFADGSFAGVPAIHSQLCKLTILGAKTYSPIDFHASTWETVDKASKELDKWRQELPMTLQLQSLLSEHTKVPEESRRSLLVLHMLYLEYRVLAYQLKMQHSEMNELLTLPREALESYVGFSQQLSWVLSFIHRDDVFSRSWIIMSVSLLSCAKTISKGFRHASWVASSMQLIGACHHLLFDLDIRATWNLLNAAQSCIDISASINRSSALSSRYSEVFGPSIIKVSQIAEEAAALTHVGREFRMRIGTVLNYGRGFEPARIVPIMRHTLASLRMLNGMNYN